MWGAPCIHGELLKLGIDISQTTVAKYMPRHRWPPSQTWRTFLTNQVGQSLAGNGAHTRAHLLHNTQTYCDRNKDPKKTVTEFGSN